MSAVRRLAACALTLMVAAACLSRVPATSYFRVAGPPELNHECPRRYSAPYTLAVMPFGASPALRQTALLYRPSPYELASYGFSRWEATPAQMLTERLEDYLESCRLFGGVTRYGLSAEPELLLRGRLTDFQEVDGPQGPQAELGLEAELVSLSGSEVVWQGRLTARTPMAERSPEELARAMSESLAAVLAEMAAQLGPALERFACAKGGQGARPRP